MFPKHALVQLVGGWNTVDMANEKWCTNIRVHTGGAAGYYLQDPQGYADAIALTIKTWFTTGSVTRNDTQIQQVKVNNINEDGHYVDPVTHGTALTGATGTILTSAPAFSTLCMTFETGRTTGLARRGRMYFPYAAAPVSGNSAAVTGGVRDSLVTKSKALLACLLINEPGGSHYLVRPAIVSRGHRTGYRTITGVGGSERLVPLYEAAGAGPNDITGISADTVLDVQRRRKNRASGPRGAAVAFP